MGQSFFRSNLASSPKKNGAPKTNKSSEVRAVIEAFNKKEAAASTASTEAAGEIEPSKGVTIYSDAALVRYFGPRTGLQRYKLVDARRPGNRGREWDVVGLHAGMTQEWTFNYAVQNHISLIEVAQRLEPVKPDDGVVSCEVVGTFPNRERVAVRILATGERELATVPRIDIPSPIDGHMMVLREGFDAKWVGSVLTWVRELNDCVYFRKSV